tara:strand:+ start:1115 stop:1978 length:864 start_codon:yes stop_codon:yes gene_type:complete
MTYVEKNPPNLDQEALAKLITEGDLGRLTPQERVQYYMAKCNHVGLDPTDTPFQYIRLNGKLTLYATKGCAEQLRKVHKVSLSSMKCTEIEGIFMCTITASTQSGRKDTDSGCVPVAGLKGEAKSNAMLKAITKAKRRVTLSLLGLGMLDDTEVETIPNAETMTPKQAESLPAATPLEKEPTRRVLTQPTVQDRGDEYEVGDEMLASGTVKSVHKQETDMYKWYEVTLTSKSFPDGEIMFTTWSASCASVCEVGTYVEAELVLKKTKKGALKWNANTVEPMDLGGAM